MPCLHAWNVTTPIYMNEMARGGSSWPSHRAEEGWLCMWHQQGCVERGEARERNPPSLCIMIVGVSDRSTYCTTIHLACPSISPAWFYFTLFFLLCAVRSSPYVTHRAQSVLRFAHTQTATRKEAGWLVGDECVRRAPTRHPEDPTPAHDEEERHVGPRRSGGPEGVGGLPLSSLVGYGPYILLSLLTLIFVMWVRVDTH